MDNFNKLFSFILGLIVVVVFFAVLTGKINFSNKINPLSGFNKVTPTPTKIVPSQKVISTLEVEGQSGNLSYNNKSNLVKTIPSTGVPTLLLPLMLSGLTGGLILRRKK